MYLPWLFRWFSRVDTRQCHFGLYPKYYFSTQLRFLCFLFGNDTLPRASFLGCFVTKLCARTAAGVLNLIADGDATGHHTRASLPREPAGQTAASVPRLSHTAMAPVSGLARMPTSSSTRLTQKYIATETIIPENVPLLLASGRRCSRSCRDHEQV
jgi:hypothetical protein